MVKKSNIEKQDQEKQEQIEVLAEMRTFMTKMSCHVTP